MLFYVQDSPITPLEHDDPLLSPPPKKKSWLGKILGTSDRISSSSSQSPTEKVRQEMQRYLNCTTQDVDSSPLEWLVERTTKGSSNSQ